MHTIPVERGLSKAELYQTLIPQIEALISSENDLIANLANVTAVLKTAFDFLWIGFYFNKNNELVLGPFQGPLACTRIEIGKGVCGTAAAEKKSIIVPNVNEFSGHIACSSLSKSEIVIPLVFKDTTQMVLDIDSEQLNDFDEIDKKYLEEIIALIKKQHYA